MNSMRHQSCKNENASTKSPWNDWLMNYIPELVKKTVGGVKDKFTSLFKLNTAEYYCKPSCVNKVRTVMEVERNNRKKKLKQ